MNLTNAFSLKNPICFQRKKRYKTNIILRGKKYNQNVHIFSNIF